MNKYALGFALPTGAQHEMLQTTPDYADTITAGITHSAPCFCFDMKCKCETQHALSSFMAIYMFPFITGILFFALTTCFIAECSSFHWQLL